VGRLDAVRAARDKLRAAVSAHVRFPPFRRLAVLVGAGALALGLAACQESHPTSGDGEGVYVDAGPITYQVQISRQLNPYSAEDREYINGVSSRGPSPSQMWFGVFLWAKNQSHSNQTTSDSFDIIDTEGDKYYPVAINPQVNPFAWTAQTLQPNGTEPGPGTVGSFGPTQGNLLLFKLNNTVYSNRPLTLEIYAPGQARPSSISLDL
jgi:hypothetical protein